MRPEQPDTRQRLLRTAWLAIVLGLALEAVTVALALAQGSVPGFGSILADTIQKVSWSFVVCVGLVIGTGAAREGIGMGFAGLLAAPFGFSAARALHKAAQSALGVTAAGAAAPSPLVMALIKGIEYGFLGAALGWYCVGKRSSAAMHAAVGMFTGIVFGGLVLYLTVVGAPAPLPYPALVPRAANELLFPLGCALVVYAARRFGESLDLAENL